MDNGASGAAGVAVETDVPLGDADVKETTEVEVGEAFGLALAAGEGLGDGAPFEPAGVAEADDPALRGVGAWLGLGCGDGFEVEVGPS